MRIRPSPLPGWVCRWLIVPMVAATGSLLAPGSAAANAPVSPIREQVIQITEGWNAVFLEVDPVEFRPDLVFAGSPIDIAAALHRRSATAQFVRDPNANLFQREGWRVWYAPDRPDAFLSTLHAVHGGQAYLLHALEACTLRIAGEVVTTGIRWRPNGFNFVGFSVASPGAPTFAEFFAGSPAHRLDRIYRLSGGNWRRVSDATAESMRSGEAFWIYCEGSSDYQGPLHVKTRVGGSVIVGRGVSGIVLRNLTGHPLVPRVEHVTGSGPPPPLSISVRVLNSDHALVSRASAALPTSDWVQDLPPLEAGRALLVPLEARPEEMQSGRLVSLLKISTDLGTENWLPVICVREDLETP